MQRRDFLKSSVFASGAVLIPSFLRGMQFLNPEQLSGYRNVIVVQLSGGNDGLSTIVPYQDDIYLKNRPNIGLQDNLFRLSDELYLNSECRALKELYDNGEMTVINSVGYPNPNRSHFRSSDIWHTGSASDQFLKNGWLGSYLDASCQSSYQGIQFDAELSLILKGKNLNGISVTDPQQLFNTTREPFFKNIAEQLDDTMLTEDNQGYLYKTLVDTYSSAEYIYEHFKTYEANTDFPNNKFGKSLKGIAQLVSSGLKTRVYYTTLGGFDTHVNQQGAHNGLMKTYSEGMGALVKELKKSDRFKDTLILTFSEFGRRVQENGSKGTDHGAANNLFVIGGGLKKPGLYNDKSNLENLDDNGDIRYEVDFRNIYATVLDNWLQADSTLVLGKDFEKLSFV